MNKELLEQLNIKRSTAVISPYIDEGEFNFNLEKQGLVIFPNSAYLCYLSSKMVGNKEVFVTGLDENSPDILQLPYEERMEQIRRIRLVVREIERYNYNNVDVEDPDFWFKVKYARPDNEQTWGNISLELKNEPVFLDLLTYDGFLKYWLASVGGFPEVAPSYEKIINGERKYKYYLKDVERITNITVTNIVAFNRAVSKLDELYSNSNMHMRLFYLSKYLTSDGYSMNMVNFNPDLCMIALDRYIKGKDPITKRQDVALKEFMDMSAKSIEYLYTANVVKGLIQIGRIKYVDKTGNYFCVDNNINVGRTISDIIDYYMIYDNFEYLNTLASMYGSQFGMTTFKGNFGNFERKKVNRDEPKDEETNIPPIETTPNYEALVREPDSKKPAIKKAVKKAVKKTTKSAAKAEDIQKMI